MKILMYSPLEQFDIVLISHVMIEYLLFLLPVNAGFDIANMDLYFILVLVLIYWLISLLKFDLYFKGLLQEMMEMVYKAILQIVGQQATTDAYPYFPYIFVTFMFIVLSDVLGMLPFGFTLTAHLCLTFFLAFSFNTAFVLIGVYKHKQEFFELFVPKDAPSFLVPLIVVIEVVSYLIRSFSLSIRLFANMMAGHCLLYVISSFIFPAVEQLGVLAVIPVSVIFSGIFVLEFSIAFLQAYVFTILLCIYLNDSLHPKH